MSFIDRVKKGLNRNDEEIVVVTAITPHFDKLVLDHHNEDSNIRFVAFLDVDSINGYLNPSQQAPLNQLQKSLKWEIRLISQRFLNPKMNAKVHKILVHEFFPRARYTIWIDGNIQVQVKSLRGLIDRMGNDDMVLFKHYTRNCLYSEAHECMFRKLDSKEKIFDQISRYTRDGFPHGMGLTECPVIIRKNNRKTKEFNNLWWDEINRGSSRDQISFPYVQYKTGAKVGYLPGTIINNEFFKKLSHNYNK